MEKTLNKKKHITECQHLLKFTLTVFCLYVRGDRIRFLVLYYLKKGN